MDAAGGKVPLEGIFDALRPFRLPPLDQWWPTKTVEFDLEIRADGRWIHEGGEIRRHELVKLFSTVLAYRDGAYFLVTPGVRYRIRVEDTPFRAVEANVRQASSSQIIWFRSDMDETFPLDGAHPLDPRTDPGSGEPSPVVEVRDGLLARLSRSVYYQLADLATENPAQRGVYGVFSDGSFHRLM